MICLSLFSDGLSTTTPTLLFNLHCLAAWPRVQEEVRREVLHNFPAPDQPLSQHTLANMQYLKAFVKETFRWGAVQLSWRRPLLGPFPCCSLLLHL